MRDFYKGEANVLRLLAGGAIEFLLPTTIIKFIHKSLLLFLL